MHAPTSHPSKRALRTGTLASVLLGLGPIGACVEPAWRAQTALREQLERQPVRFMTLLW